MQTDKLAPTHPPKQAKEMERRVCRGGGEQGNGAAGRRGELGRRARDRSTAEEPTFRLEGLDLVGDGVGQACLCRGLLGACPGMRW